MDQIHLTSLELRELISRYQSELRKLGFQAEKTRQTISELEEALRQKSGGRTHTEYPTHAVSHELEESNAPKEVKEQFPDLPEDVQIVEHQPAEVSTRTRGKLSEKKRENLHRLSEWDEWVINLINESEHGYLRNSDFLEAGKYYFKDMPEEEIRGRTSRSLHKLANKKGLLAKINIPGKGYGYTISEEWLEKNHY